ncbi:MAG: NUDIX domain-containing protein [Nocardioidaceae bacterium]
MSAQPPAPVTRRSGHPTARRRVACYVVRETGDGRELLVFDHVGVPEAGTQVPAGGTEHAESVEEAAVREVAEECGVSASVVRLLGVSLRPHVETGAPQHTSYVLMRYDGRGDRRGEPWTWQVSGAGVDEGMLFRCWFTPLPLDGVELAGHQEEFLGEV